MLVFTARNASILLAAFLECGGLAAAFCDLNEYDQ
jgi:hypothetical protein